MRNCLLEDVDPVDGGDEWESGPVKSNQWELCYRLNAADSQTKPAPCATSEALVQPDNDSLWVIFRLLDRVYDDARRLVADDFDFKAGYQGATADCKTIMSHRKAHRGGSCLPCTSFVNRLASWDAVLSSSLPTCGKMANENRWLP